MAERVRVTGPPRHAPRRLDGGSSRWRDLRDQRDQRDLRDQGEPDDGGIGEVYLRSLLREQLALAARVLLVLGVGLGSLPLLFHLAPGVAAREVLGLPVAWVLLGGLTHPFLLVLGWRYVRRAERNERVFADLLDTDPLGDPSPGADGRAG